MAEAKDIGRSIAAIIAGYFLMAMVGFFLTTVLYKVFLPPLEPGTLPANYLLINLIGSSIAALIGGYLAAFGAGRAPLIHALILAGIVMTMSLLSISMNPGIVPKWYGITMSSMLPILVAIGGLIRRQSSGIAAR